MIRRPGPPQSTSFRGGWRVWDHSLAPAPAEEGSESWSEFLLEHPSRWRTWPAVTAASGSGGRCLPGARHRTPREAGPAFSRRPRCGVRCGAERGAGPAPAPLGGRVPKGSALLSWSPGGSSPASTALSEDMIECGRFPGVLPAPCFLPVLSLIKQNREGSEGGLRHKGARFGDRVRGHFLAIRSLRGRIAQAKRNSLWKHSGV